MRCAVVGCSNNNNQKLGYKCRFFHFPKDAALAKKWLHFCGRQDELNEKYACICEVHFTPEDFERNIQYEMENSTKLRRTAFPTKNNANSRETDECRKRKEEEENLVDCILNEPTKVSDSENMVEEPENIHTPADAEMDDDRLEMEMYLKYRNLSCKMKCRSCMQIDCEVVELHSNVSEDGKTFYDYFNECTKLNATKSDELPKILCINCAENLQVAYNFISEAIRCDKELKKLLSRQKIESSLEILEEVESYKSDPLSFYDSTEQNEDLLGVNEGDVKTEITVEILNISEAITQTYEDSEEGSLCSTILYCDICSLEYPTVNDFQAHFNELHKNDVTCTKCSKLFELPRERYLHDKLVHSKFESSMHCPWCQYCRYVSRNELIEHVQANHYKSYLKYFVLSSSQNDDDNLKKDFSSYDYDLAEGIEIEKFDCPICFISFSEHETYEEHIKEAHSHSTTDDIPMPLTKNDNYKPDFPQAENDENPKEAFECLECPKQFQLKKSLLRHIRQKHGGFSINNVTATNRKITKNKNSITAVSEDQEEHSIEDLVECKYCNKKLVSTKISKHENRHEYRLKKKGKYLCSLCPREFGSEISVKVHERRIHLHQRPEPKECPICHKRFDTKYLKAHIANVHPTERKFVCDICGCAYKTKLYLREHKLLHVERKLPCTLCNKKFVRPTDLKKHMRSHTGEKPYACEVCDKRFAFKGEYNNHMQHHAGIKHKCKDCDKEFNDKKQLSIHSYKHKGMPYRCSICAYGCSRRHVFKQHLLRVHDMTMTPHEYSAMFQANTGRTANVLSLEELQSQEDY